MSEINPSYVLRRNDILDFVPLDAVNILDVGCSVGTVGEALKTRAPEVEVTGIEFDPAAAAEARQRLDRVIQLDLNAGDLEFDLPAAYFDCILFGDVLEHLVDPWGRLEKFKQYLRPGGVVVTSLPNIRHLDTVFNLVVRGKWPYRERGIHDRTHLRFFTLKNIEELFAGASLKITRLRRIYRIMERPHILNRQAWLLRLVRFWPIREFFTFQYTIQASLDDRIGEKGVNERKDEN
jgi:2-polyprenyl-3-methyl-5-hydroxy-6-metoxy-1,4-benzoquinol methylase